MRIFHRYVTNYQRVVEIMGYWWKDKGIEAWNIGIWPTNVRRNVAFTITHGYVSMGLSSSRCAANTGKRRSWAYPLVIWYVAKQNGHLQWVFPWKIVIFNSFVTNRQRVVSILQAIWSHRVFLVYPPVPRQWLAGKSPNRSWRFLGILKSRMSMVHFPAMFDDTG